MKFLLEIYEQEKDWQKAIETSRKLDSGRRPVQREGDRPFLLRAGGSRDDPRAHWDQARDYLRDALSVNRKCVRAHILLGDLAMRQGSPEEAIEYWKRVEAQNPAYLALVAEKLLAAHRSSGGSTRGCSCCAAISPAIRRSTC